MKTAETLEKSIRAKINEAEAMALLVANCATDLQQEFKGTTMAEMRGYLAKLTQCVHEYNAYYNCLHTS